MTGPRPAANSSINPSLPEQYEYLSGATLAAIEDARASRPEGSFARHEARSARSYHVRVIDDGIPITDHSRRYEATRDGEKHFGEPRNTNRGSLATGGAVRRPGIQF